jgi:hypothetical protein
MTKTALNNVSSRYTVKACTTLFACKYDNVPENSSGPDESKNKLSKLLVDIAKNNYLPITTNEAANTLKHFKHMYCS